MADRYQELLKLAQSNKATLEEKAELAQLISQEVTSKKDDLMKEKIDKVKNLLEELKLDIKTVYQQLNPPPPKNLAIEWTWQGKTYQRYEGEKGKLALWLHDFKRENTIDKALEYCKTEKGKEFVRKFYSK